ncbi:MAG: fused MFS/spermidine synthase [Pseudomonadota bacterium]
MPMRKNPEIVPPEWITLPWTHFAEKGVVRILRKPGTPESGELWRRLSSDEMTQPFIFESREERRLHFTWNCTQSVMRRDDPVELVSPYTRKMMSFLLLNPLPEKILILGLGGGALPKFCYSRLPRTDITVVEFNADVIALRDEFQIPADGTRFRVIHADGAAYVQGLAAPVDVILVDAFDPHGIARTLATPQFYARAANCLSERGLLVMNFWGDPERYVDNLNAAARAFGAHLRLVSTSSGGNIVVFATRRSAPTTVTRNLESLSHRLQAMLQLDFPRYLRRLCQGETL